MSSSVAAPNRVQRPADIILPDTLKSILLEYEDQVRRENKLPRLPARSPISLIATDVRNTHIADIA